ncbi:MAG: hypothetical protein AB8B83_08225 [Bdellovibrionales bacterium]
MADIKMHKLLWLIIPVFIFIAQIAIELLVPKDILPTLHSEGGPHETLQFIFIAVAFIMAILILIRIKKSNMWLSLWVAIAALASFYVAGEEVSWGQHFFDWGTPEFWQGLNDQGETNLHNTSSWLDQKPRLILLMGTIVGGLIIPTLAKFRPSALPQKFAIIYPPAILSVTAGFALTVKIIDKIQDMFDNNLFTRAAEIEELYLYYFVLLYLLGLMQRVKRHPA